jgi:hypothetical protein
MLSRPSPGTLLSMPFRPRVSRRSPSGAKRMTGGDDEEPWVGKLWHKCLRHGESPLRLLSLQQQHPRIGHRPYDLDQHPGPATPTKSRRPRPHALPQPEARSAQTREADRQAHPAGSSHAQQPRISRYEGERDGTGRLGGLTVHPSPSLTGWTGAGYRGRASRPRSAPFPARP